MDDLRSAHFIGIGGIGMSALAFLLLDRGVKVSGSDVALSPLTRRLEDHGASVRQGHTAEQIGDADLVVYSSAIHPSNPELRRAREENRTCLHRAELLRQLMRGRRRITVAGCHGKSTTAAMAAVILRDAGLDPTIMVGADVIDLGGNAVSGDGRYFLAEADESDRSFLKLQPELAVVTNVDYDHSDAYADVSAVRQAFRAHMNGVSEEGRVLACRADRELRSLFRNVHRPMLTYGWNREADYCAVDVSTRGFRTQYTLGFRGEKLGRIQLELPGRFNLLNSLGAAALAHHLGTSFTSIRESLDRFRGVRRRFERKGKRNEVAVIDDYGHHPTEIESVLEACRSFGERLHVVFQPHRYSRTESLLEPLSRSFGTVDSLILLPIYSAGETPRAISSERLAEEIRKHRPVEMITSFEEAVQRLESLSRPGDLIVTLGAGDVWKIGDQFLEKSK